MRWKSLCVLFAAAAVLGCAADASSSSSGDKGLDELESENEVSNGLEREGHVYVVDMDVPTDPADAIVDGVLVRPMVFDNWVLLPIDAGVGGAQVKLKIRVFAFVRGGAAVSINEHLGFVWTRGGGQEAGEELSRRCIAHTTVAGHDWNQHPAEIGFTTDRGGPHVLRIALDDIKTHLRKLQIHIAWWDHDDVAEACDGVCPGSERHEATYPDRTCRHAY